MAEGALDTLSDELDARSRYSEMESIGERLGPESGLEWRTPCPPRSRWPGRFLAGARAAVATLPGGTGSRGFGPVSVTLNVDARGATREDAGAIGDELEGRVQKVLRDVLAGGGQQYGASVAGGYG